MRCGEYVLIGYAFFWKTALQVALVPSHLALVLDNFMPNKSSKIVAVVGWLLLQLPHIERVSVANLILSIVSQLFPVCSEFIFKIRMKFSSVST